ncbi:hypothetical protein RB653_009120 [Dictyostelium firmibasis]|uniref:EGF-like domain-containing protein n=1 Tax=Dictyostelium firmibasis TaxID=79012 RepID=A0AAN7TU10_9MYCE
MIKIFHLIFFIFLINCIFSLTPPQPINPIKNPQNGHYYQVFNNKAAYGVQITGPNSTNHCNDFYFNGTKGYLVTFTSEEEWNWGKENNFTTSGMWVSGSDAEKTGTWKYSKGSPEEDDNMYNLYFDKCYSFCIFGSLEPNLIKDEHWLHTSGSVTVPYINNIGPLALMDKYVCEFGGYEEPHIPPSPTTGSNVIVKNLGSFTVDSQLSIRFTNRANSSKTFSCVTLTKIDNSNVQCVIPPGQGKFTVQIKDSKNKINQLPIFWNYELPMIGGVYPNFTKGSVATITGANFGTVASEIVVTLGAPGVSCSSIVIKQQHEVFTCVLSENLTGNKFLPITITVSKNTFVSFKAAIFYNGYYYSGFLAWATFQTSMIDYASNLRIDGQIGHMGSLYDDTLIQFANNTLPVQNGNARWILWQNAQYIGNGNFVYITGPNQGKPCVLKYKSIIGGDAVKATWTKDTRFVIYLDTLELTNMTTASYTGVLTEYGGIPPSFTTINKTNYIDTIGGKVDIGIDNYGTVFSEIKVFFNGSSVPYEKDYINGELDVQIPAGFDGPYEIVVQVGTLTTSPKTQFLKYNQPSINSMNRVPTTGGVVTISGSSFSNILSNTFLTFKTCTSLTILVPFKSYTCVLPVGSGSIPVSLKISNQTTTTTYQYSEPSITYSNNIAQVGGTLSISGNNFGVNSGLIKVYITGGSGNVNVECKNVVIVEDHTKISCFSPPLSPDTYSLEITVDSISSNDPQYQIEYFNSDLYTNQENADLLIVGKDLSDATTLSIILGSVNISSYCSGSQTLIKCTNLPLSVISGTLSITQGDKIYPSIPVTLKPWISSISNQLLDTVETSDVTITGRYFEQPIKVSRDNTTELIVNEDYTIISPEEIILHIYGGFGLNHTVLVENQNQLKSNKVIYSFFKPELLSVIQEEDSVTIIGRNLSKTLSTLIFGSYEPIIKSIDSFKIEFDLTISKSRNGDIYVIVDSQRSNSLSLNIYPILNSIKPIPSSFNSTSKITISGKYLFEEDSNKNLVDLQFQYTFKTPSVNSPNGFFSNCLSIVQGTEYECDIEPGYGQFEIVAVSKSTLISNSLQSEYESPIVLKVLSQVYLNEPIDLLISVLNFKINFTNVVIEDQECTNVSIIDQTTIKCKYQSTIPLPSERKGLNIKVISAELSGENDCLVYSTLYDCELLNNCSGHGDCNKKLPKCICYEGWRGQDCSIDNEKYPPQPEPPIIDDNGSTTFPGSKINYTVAITHLVEMNFNNNPVRFLSLSEIEWTNRTGLSNTSNFYSGNFKKQGDNSTIFELIIHYFSKEGEIEFAGESLYMPENSIKYQATILGWKFSSELNYLVTIFKSKTDSSENYNCEPIDTQSKYLKNQYQVQTFSTSLTGKFASRAIIDERIVQTELIQIDRENNSKIYNFIGASIDDSDQSKFSLRTGVVSPRFNTKTIIDPSFGQLLRPVDDSNDNNCSSNKWKVPVIVVVSVVGGSTIVATASVFYYRKLKNKKSMKRLSVSMNSMKD